MTVEIQLDDHYLFTPSRGNAEEYEASPQYHEKEHENHGKIEVSYLSAVCKPKEVKQQDKSNPTKGYPEGDVDQGTAVQEYDGDYEHGDCKVNKQLQQSKRI